MVSMRMRSRLVVVFDELANQIVEMILAEGDEVIETFVLDGLNKTFNSGIQVG